jgi:gliding motility-associated-like protein
MKNLCFLSMLFIGVTAGLKAQVTSITIELDETFTEPLPDQDLTGYRVFSVYANFTNPNDFVSAVYGVFNDQENIVVNFTCDCFNSPIAGITAGQNNAAFWPTFPSMQYDSYLTIGQESNADPGFAQFIASVPPTAVAVNEFETNCSMNVDDGAIFTTYPSPNGFAGADLKVKIAQFTTCGNFCFEFGLQVFVNGNQLDAAMTNHAICSDLCALNPLDNSISLTQDFDCQGNPAVIEFGGGGNGAITYELYDNNGGNPILVSFQTDDPTFEVTQGGEYYGVLIDEVGCSVQTDILALAEPNPLVISQTSFTDILCANNGGAICINVSGGNPPYNVTAQMPDGNLINLNNPDCLSGIQCSNGNGTVIINASDSQGCETSYSAEFSCPSPLNANIAVTNLSCNGSNNGVLNVAVSGGTGPYSALVSGNGLNLPFPNFNQSVEVENLSAGNYTIGITDNLGCFVVLNATIAQPAPLTVSASSIAPSCEEACNGSISLSASGGTGPYSFILLQDGQPVPTENLCEGIYIAQVIDANNCTAQVDVTLVANLSTLGLSATADDLTCFGLCDSEVEFNASGGEAPYSFTLFQNGETIFNSDLCDGNYIAVVTDAVGCTAQDNVIIDTPNPLTGFVLQADSICEYDLEGNINYAGVLCVSDVGGGTPGYSYSLEGGPSQNEACFDQLAAGNYEITIEDENGCTREVSGSIPVVNDPNHPLYPICFPNIIIPNIFSPNGDNSSEGGTNEFFFIDGLQAYPNSKIRIFNRWGNLVFESDNYKNNWDANESEDGVYFYTLEVNILGSFSGTVTVVR